MRCHIHCFWHPHLAGAKKNWSIHRKWVCYEKSCTVSLNLNCGVSLSKLFQVSQAQCPKLGLSSKGWAGRKRQMRTSASSLRTYRRLGDPRHMTMAARHCDSFASSSRTHPETPPSLSRYRFYILHPKSFVELQVTSYSQELQLFYGVVFVIGAINRPNVKDCTEVQPHQTCFSLPFLRWKPAPAILHNLLRIQLSQWNSWFKCRLTKRDPSRNCSLFVRQTDRQLQLRWLAESSETIWLSDLPRVRGAQVDYHNVS